MYGENTFKKGVCYFERCMCISGSGKCEYGLNNWIFGRPDRYLVTVRSPIWGLNET